MVIFIILTTVFLVHVPPVTAAGEIKLVDSYSQTNQSADIDIQAVHPDPTGATSVVGQSFMSTSGDYKLTSVKFYLKMGKWWSPAVGNLQAQLYAHTGTFGSGGKPTDGPLAVSNLVSMAVLVFPYANPWVLCEFTFPTGQQYGLVNNVPYGIVVIVHDATRIDRNNYYIEVGIDNTSPTHQGNTLRYWSGWSGISYQDTIFYVYGEKIELTPPSVNAGLDQVVNEGDTVNFSGSYTNPGIGDTIAWDFGDGTTASGTLTPAHVYGDNGVYTVTLTVTNVGGVGTNSLTVTVNNISPTATINSISQPNPQFILPTVHTLTCTGSFTNPGWLDTHTATWDFGDGTVVFGTLSEENIKPDATGITTAQHVYSKPGTYVVTLTITDDDGGVGTYTTQVKVIGAKESNAIINKYIQSLPNEAFKNNPTQLRKAFNNMFAAINQMLDNEEYRGAIEDLRNNIRAKADGFVDGNPKNDWIIDPTAQKEICMSIDDLTAYLETLL